MERLIFFILSLLGFGWEWNQDSNSYDQQAL
jgi:hypothetical protein